jgi:IS30 family transposase
VKRNDFSIEIKAYVENLINEDYSPEQIVVVAKNNKRQCVSIEWIYQHIWSDKKEGGRLYKHLRNKGKRYQKRGSKKGRRGIIQGRVSIDERPKIVDKIIRIGDLEMDLVIGKNHKKAILTINDRATGKVKISLLNSKSADEIRGKTLAVLKDWKPWLKTITTDNEKEFAQHQDIAKFLEIDYFFAHLYHSWERGANENFKGLLRQYYPKKYDFNLITKEDLQAAEDELNNRPRKRFGFLTPNQVYLQALNNNRQVAFKT